MNILAWCMSLGELGYAFLFFFFSFFLEQLQYLLSIKLYYTILYFCHLNYFFQIEIGFGLFTAKEIYIWVCISVA